MSAWGFSLRGRVLQEGDAATGRFIPVGRKRNFRNLLLPTNLGPARSGIDALTIKGRIMKKIWLTGAFLLLATPVLAEQPPVVVTPVMTTNATISGQPIVLPQKNAEVVVANYEIAPGASLPVHKHPFPRYAYVLAGTLQVTNTETGKDAIYETGAFIVEAVGQWHKGANIGKDPVKLLVIDMIEQGANNVVKQ